MKGKPDSLGRRKDIEPAIWGNAIPPEKFNNLYMLPYTDGFLRGSDFLITLFIKQPNGLRRYQNGFVWTNHSDVSLRNPWVKSWQWSSTKSLRSHKHYLNSPSLHFFIFEMEKTRPTLHRLLGRLSGTDVLSQVHEGKHSLSKPKFPD